MCMLCELRYAVYVFLLTMRVLYFPRDGIYDRPDEGEEDDPYRLMLTHLHVRLIQCSLTKKILF